MQSSWVRRSIACAIGLVAAAVAFECALRFMLFADNPLARSVGYRLRRARCYCDYKSDEDYWKLALRFGEVGGVPKALYHPELGWLTDEFDRETLRHARVGELRGRRPVLLYGDSFAHCMTSRDDCFEALLDRSDLASRHCLLNYGVPGYGLDQIQMLIERTVDAFADQDPIVVVGIFVDDDLDRVSTRIRNWPKPRYTIDGGALRLDAPPVPSVDEFVAANPLRIRSYAWRWLLYGSNLVPKGVVAWISGEERVAHEKQEISRRILDEIERGLSARGIEHFYLLFLGDEHLAPEHAADWRDETLADFLRRTGAHFVSSAPYLRRAAAARGESPAVFFETEGNRSGHYRPEGNAVVFTALCDGLEQRWNAAEEHAPAGSSASRGR